ncbi:MAG: hypothetical protein E6767_03040 [Dysgonomonas sp.]|nr:hypothetical protein [Dysgonomonas sp.]
MIPIDSFFRLNNHFYSFTFTLDDKNYSSGILFSETCTDNYFKEVFPSIKETLLWLTQNTNNIKEQIRDRLPLSIDVDLFDTFYIVSFSLTFNRNNPQLPTIYISYGKGAYDVYIIVTLNKEEILDIEENK